MEENKELFSSFPDTSKEQWIAQAVKDLKGADFKETLFYTTPDQIEIGPFYTAEDLRPGTAPLFHHTDWDICVRISVTDEQAANRSALHQLEHGATGLIFDLTRRTNLDQLLEGIQIAYISLQFNLAKDVTDFSQDLQAYLKARDLQQDQLNLKIAFDPISNLVRTGNWLQDAAQDLTTFTTSAGRMVCIDGSLYHDAGASPAYELACLLAHANEYLHLRNEAQQLTGTALQISLAAGADYFTGISKLRALRKVFALLLRNYGLDENIQLQVESATRTLTIYDNHNNLLRTTTEAMAAAAGGCNSLVVLPFDAVFRTPDTFSERMARNIQLILKHESYFDKVADVAAGSYFIEELTEQLAQKAWADFKAIEASGGFLASLKSGAIQDVIRASSKQEQHLFDENKKVLVGTNKYPNPDQQMNEKVTATIWQETKTGTAIEPLIAQRLAAKTESARLNIETRLAKNG